MKESLLPFQFHVQLTCFVIKNTLTLKYKNVFIYEYLVTDGSQNLLMVTQTPLESVWIQAQGYTFLNDKNYLGFYMEHYEPCAEPLDSKVIECKNTLNTLPQQEFVFF